MIKIKTLTSISIEQIHETFSKAFADYVEPFDLTVDQLQYMIERRGYNPDLSFGAFNDNELVGFTLNGIGEWNGEETAYDTGTGIIKEFRKQGIATRIFNESLPVLRENDVTQYLLEVIKSNTGAYDLYKKAGFTVTREFDYFTSTKDKIKIDQNKLHANFQIKEIKNPNWEEVQRFWDFEPSWQNSIESIKRKIDGFKILEIFVDEKIAGYGIVEKHSGDFTQLAIAKEHRRKGLATILFEKLLNNNENEEVRIINSDATCTPFKEFVKSINLSVGLGQYEMIMNL